jgi:hypothetical protein
MVRSCGGSAEFASGDANVGVADITDVAAWEAEDSTTTIHFVFGISSVRPRDSHPSTPSMRMLMSAELFRDRMLAAVVAQYPARQ